MNNTITNNTITNNTITNNTITNNTNTAKKLTFDEIAALPKASVIWMSWHNTTDEGIVWHEVVPAMVAVPGKNGLIIGGDKQDTWDRDIDVKSLFDEPSSEYWDSEPDREQLPGLTLNECEAIPAELEQIQFTELARAITSRGLTFEQVSDITGIKHKRLLNILTGKSEIVQWEIVAIIKALNMGDDETISVFFS